MEKLKVLKERVDWKTFGLHLVAMLAFSLVLPFVLGLFQALLHMENLKTVFAHWDRYFVLSGILFFEVLVMELAIFLNKDLSQRKNHLGVIFLAILLTVFSGLLVSNFISTYAAPLFIGGLFIAILIDKKFALFANVMLCINYIFILETMIVDYEVLQAVSSVLVSASSGSILILIMRKAYSRINFLVNSITVGLLAAVPLAFLSGYLIEGMGVLQMFLSALWSFISVFLGIALFMIILPVFERIFKLYSDFRLEEICSPEYPLLKRLAKEAQGTYYHSAAVANLAVACAMNIGENAMLAKAVAYYHDVGKLKNPLCFTENQKGYNPHDDFIPEVSIFMIIDHTNYGYQLLKEHHLPDVICDIAKEHHGTTPIRFFWNKAKNLTDNELNNTEFSYPGPKPKSKVAAIVMIADTVEAATRAQGVDPDPKHFRAYVKKLIQDKVTSDQFSECPITFQEIQTIEDTLVEVLPNLYHQRIKYEK